MVRPATPEVTPLTGDRVLILMRHAKSSWSTGLPDHERPLAARGRRDGLAAATWLTARALTPDLALVSDSVRTRQTAERLVAGGCSPARISHERELYDANERDLVRIIRRTPDEVATLMLIGHNPAIEETVHLLARRVGNHAWWAAIDEKFPTSAIAVLGFDGRWADVEPGVGALLAYEVPRG